jgi:hypothetical protein
MAKFEQQDPNWEEGLTGKVVGLVADIEISDEVAVELADRFGEGTHVAFIAPAITEGRLEHIAGIADDARVEAESRIEASVKALESAGGIEADAAAVGDQDPVIAIEDLLRRGEGAVEEVVLVTRADGDRRWAEEDAFDRIRQRVPVPVTTIAVASDGEIVDSEHSDPGKDSPQETTVDVESHNLPRFSARELLAMVVGAVATIILAALGAYGIAESRDAADGADTSVVIAALLAVFFFLINVPHILGLTLFQSTGYRGIWSTLFSRLSLYGTPLAVVVSAILVL